MTTSQCTADQTESRDLGPPRLILVSISWPTTLFENESALKSFVQRAEAAVRAVVSPSITVTTDFPRLALVLDNHDQPKVTVIGERTDAYGPDSPLGSSVLAAVRSELSAESD